MGEPKIKSGLKVEMDVAQGKVQGLADTGKFDPGLDTTAPGVPGEGGQAAYANTLPDQYHSASDLGDPGFGFRDTGPGITKYGANPTGSFDFGQGPGQQASSAGFMATGPEYGVQPGFRTRAPDEPVKGNQPITGGVFEGSSDPNLLQAAARDVPKGPLQITGTVQPNNAGPSPGGGSSANSSKGQPTIDMPGVMNPPLSGKPGIKNRTDAAQDDARNMGVNDR